MLISDGCTRINWTYVNECHQNKVFEPNMLRQNIARLGNTECESNKNNIFLTISSKPFNQIIRNLIYVYVLLLRIIKQF